MENGHSKTSEENTSRHNSVNRSDEEGSSVTRDQRYVRHADDKNERRGVYTNDHHQPTTQTRRHHDEDHRKQQTTVSSHHQKERTQSDLHESNGGSHRDSRKCTQATTPSHLRLLGSTKSPTTTAGHYSQELRELGILPTLGNRIRLAQHGGPLQHGVQCKAASRLDWPHPTV